MTGNVPASGGTLFDRPILILCEGIGDKCLLHQVISNNSALHGKFCIKFPGSEVDPTGGRGKFAQWLKYASAVSESFCENVKLVVIISDADSSRAASLHEITQGLFNHGLPVPMGESQIAIANSDFPCGIVIHLLPKDANGSMDTLCASALGRAWNLTEAVADFVQKTPAKDWPPTKQSKATLHCLLGTTCATKPEANLATVWRENPSFHIPLDGDEFSSLITSLVSVAMIFPSDHPA